MNVFLHELKSYRKVTIIWILSLMALSSFFFMILPAFEKDAAEIDKLFSSFPEPILKAFNMGIASIASINGFYPFVISYILLMGAIQAMHLGLSLFSGETSGKVADFIFTKPISRVSLMHAKLLALLSLLLTTSGIYLLFSLFLGSVFSVRAYDKTAYLMTSLTLVYLQLIFAAIGVIVGVFRQKIKSVSAYAMSIVFSFFIINALGSALDSKTLRYFSPFSYFSTNYILQNHAYESQFVVLSVVIILASVSIAYYVYANRDIHSA